MICEKCGGKTPAGSKFCCNCGNPIEIFQFDNRAEKRKTCDALSALWGDNAVDLFDCVSTTIRLTVMFIVGVRKHSRKSGGRIVSEWIRTAPEGEYPYSPYWFDEKEAKAYSLMREKILEAMKEVAEKYREGEL